MLMLMEFDTALVMSEVSTVENMTKETDMVVSNIDIAPNQPLPNENGVMTHDTRMFLPVDLVDPSDGTGSFADDSSSRVSAADRRP